VAADNNRYSYYSIFDVILVWPIDSAQQIM
jgi:hypothetical protein